jgi:hypothetical protein
MNERLFIQKDNNADNSVKTGFGLLNLLPMPNFKHRIIGITVYWGWYQPPKFDHIVPYPKLQVFPKYCMNGLQIATYCLYVLTLTILIHI